MAQISKGDTFVDGQQVTGARLNQLVDSSVLLVGAITDQPSITANTLVATDSTIVNDGGVLKEATVGDFLNSNLPITTSSVTGGAGVDIVVTPAATRKLDIAGAFEADSINSVGATTIGGNLTVTGSSTLTGNVIADNAFTSNGVASFAGTANFTGTLQVGGSVGYVLYQTYEETLTSWTASSTGVQSAVVTTASFTKPSDEVWIFEIEGTWSMVRGYGASYAFRYSTETFRTGGYLKIDSDYSSGVTSSVSRSIYHSWTVPAGTALTARTVVTDVYAGSGSALNMFRNTSLVTDIITTGSLPVSKFRIYKYKTA
jgi:hypothetical protein